MNRAAACAMARGLDQRVMELKEWIRGHETSIKFWCKLENLVYSIAL